MALAFFLMGTLFQAPVRAETAERTEETAGEATVETTMGTVREISRGNDTVILDTNEAESGLTSSEAPYQNEAESPDPGYAEGSFPSGTIVTIKELSSEYELMSGPAVPDESHAEVRLADTEGGVEQSAAFHATITTNNDTYESGTTAIVNVHYALDPGVAPGDYVIMTIPEDIASSVSFSLNTQHFSGYEYLGNGQYKLIFGEGVGGGLSGSFSTFVTTNADTTTTDNITIGDASKEIAVVPGGGGGGEGVYTDAIMKDATDNPGLSYGGYDYSDGYGDAAALIMVGDLSNGGTFKYRLYVNQKEAVLSNVTVIDQLPDGMSFNSGNGFQVLDAASGSAIDSSLYSISVSGQTITFTYPGEFSNTIQINYWIDIPAGSNTSRYTNTATITYTQDGCTYQEHRNSVLQGSANSAVNGEKSVDKTEISTDADDQYVTYTIKFWNNNGFDAGDINLVDVLDPYVRFVSASQNEYFSITQDPNDPQRLLISNIEAIPGTNTEYVRFIVDMINVPEGYTVENTVGGNTTKTTKDVSVQIHATKTVDGRQPREQKFEFELCNTDGTVLQIKSNNAAGEITFDALNFGPDDIGTRVYTIREKTDPNSPYTQDTTVYTVTVTILRDESTGSLMKTVEYTKDGSTVDPENVVFNNISPAPASTSVTLGGTKRFGGFPDGAEAPVFTYTLSENGEVKDTQTTQGAGSYQFDSITYEAAGIHVYTVKETRGTASGVIYDETEYTVTVTVTDDGSGKLKVVISGINEDGSGLDFANTYVPNITYGDLTVTKTGYTGVIVGGKTTTAKSTNTRSSVPRTGDDSTTPLWLSLMGISLLGMAGTLLMNRKKHR